MALTVTITICASSGILPFEKVLSSGIKLAPRYRQTKKAYETSGGSEGMVRVLIVDDEPAISDSLSIILGDAGYDVKCASDGQAALQEATVWKPDVILSDLNMPRMGGEELLRRVRQTRALAHIPLIAMSALAPAPGLSFAGFLHKPFSVLAMLTLVRKILC